MYIPHTCPSFYSLLSDSSDGFSGLFVFSLPLSQMVLITIDRYHTIVVILLCVK